MEQRCCSWAPNHAQSTLVETSVYSDEGLRGGTPPANDSCSGPRTTVVELVRAQWHGVIEEGTRMKITADDPCDLPPPRTSGPRIVDGARDACPRP